MKKTLTALFALSGTLIFAYLTKPSINLPILRARLEKSAQSQRNKAGNFTPTTEELQQPLPFPRNSQTSANKAWHDAIASDVPRQMMVHSAVSQSGINDLNSGNGHWKILNENSDSQGVGQNSDSKTVKKGGLHSFRKTITRVTPAVRRRGSRTLENRQLDSRLRGNDGYAQLHNARSHQQHKFPKLSGEKRLLIDWVRSGKIPGSEKHVASAKTPSHQPAKNKQNSDSQSDPLAKAFRLARKKARLSARQLKAAKRKAERAKIARKKNMGEKRSISSLLGGKAIQSPRTKVSPPPNPWDNKALPPMPKGESSPSEGLSLADAERLPPPPKGTSKSGKTWLTNGTATYYHDGSHWGVLANGRWGWIVNTHGKSFLYPSPDSKPLLQSKGYLWVQDQEALLIYHNGQALGGDELSQWKQDHAGVKPNIRYSPDLKRMAIGSTVFDLETGKKL